MTTYTTEQLAEIVRLHAAWIEGKPEGQRANLSNADLSGAYLSWADLRWADLRWANLSNADLRWADLRNAYLRWADLSNAYLSNAYLRGADLSNAYLSEADLRWANLSNADLREADLRGADLDQVPVAYVNSCSRDMLFIFHALKAELPFLRAKLVAGEIDGTCYEGDCACLIGTLANADGGLDQVCAAIPYYGKGLHNPAEQWFFQIRIGDTPENNQFAAHALKLIDSVLNAPGA